MTNWKFDHSFADFDKFAKFFVGADKFADRLLETQQYLANAAVTAYPPFNLKKTDDNKYVIEMAVAGFSKSDIEITLEGNKLIVKGNTQENETDDNFIFKGIANRNFSREFKINDKIEIENAELANGMLKIWLQNMIKAQDLVKKIPLVSKEEK